MPRIRPYSVLLAVILVGCSSQPEPTPDSPASTAAPAPNAIARNGAPKSEQATPQERPGLAEPTARPRGLSSAIISPAMAQSELPLRLPAPPVPPVVRDTRVADLKAKIAKYKLFAAYRTLESIYLSAGDYASAARLYREESALYAAKGLRDAAIISTQNAARYDPATSLFQEREPSSAEVKALYSGAPNEPFVGCYIGAFIDRDDVLRETYLDENFQTHRTATEWAQVVGKPHGSHFMYLSFKGKGGKFPRRWVEELKASGVIPHIAWEPQNLDEVKDDKYLQDFAKECASVDWPIFIRFASEMNGRWTPYHGNPKKYREKFALMHRVMHRYAPRVATIWCVNNPPLGNASDYYPGDNGCDWVGVNFYSVPYHENKRAQPAFEESPLALLDPIYQKYASRKPIAICEYAASHEDGLERINRNSFAIQKMSAIYSALPRLYPRVKLIDWFSMDTIARPVPGKTRNNYTLTQQPQVLGAYRRLTASPYFLGRAQRLADPKPFLPRPLLENTRVRGVERLSAWSNLQLAGTKVFATLGNKVVYASAKPGAHEMTLDFSQGPFGQQKFEVLVYDAKNRFVTRASRMVQVLN